MRLQIELVPRQKSSLTLRNPVMLASGTAGYGLEYARLAEIQRLGAFVCNGVTLRPYAGAAQPLILEAPSGLLSALDQPNPGLQAVLKTSARTWANWETPVIVNLAGTEIAEFVQLATRLESVPGVAALELNLACPDFAADDLPFDANPTSVERLVSAVRQATALPLLAKLSASIGDVRATALAAASAGADALTLVTGQPGLRIDVHTRRPLLFGALSGPAIRPLALRLIYEVAHELRRSYPQVPLIGGGGIVTAHDALEFLLAGATAIQIGSITFANPRAAIKIVEGLEAFLESEGVADIAEIIGAAQPD